MSWCQASAQRSCGAELTLGSSIAFTDNLRCHYVMNRAQGGGRSLRRWLTMSFALASALVALLSLSTAAQASVGVGVQAAPVRLGSVAHPGGSYALVPLYVVNTGTQPESISVRVERLSRGRGLAVPSSWIQVTASGVHLDPHQSERIPLMLVVPDGAKSGSYLSDIVVTGSAEISVGRANLGVAAATKLEFSVRPGPGHGLLPSLPTWTWWAIAALLLLALAVLGVRRSGLQIRVERKDRQLPSSRQPREEAP
jgi:hypothetical protein